MIGGTGVLGGDAVRRAGPGRGYVVVAGRSEERGNERVSRRSKKLGGKAYVRRSRRHRPRIDADAALDSGRQAASAGSHALVNCAGVNSPTPYFDITDEEFDRIMTTNLLATHLGCQVFGKHMIEAGGGAILNIGSVTSYPAAVARVHLLGLEGRRAESHAERGPRVRSAESSRELPLPWLLPGRAEPQDSRPDAGRNIMRHTPMGRLANAPELIGAALLLLSPDAGSFITGEAIYVDGGFTAMTI